MCTLSLNHHSLRLARPERLKCTPRNHKYCWLLGFSNYHCWWPAVVSLLYLLQNVGSESISEKLGTSKDVRHWGPNAPNVSLRLLRRNHGWIEMERIFPHCLLVSVTLEDYFFWKVAAPFFVSLVVSVVSRVKLPWMFCFLLSNFKYARALPST